MKKSLKINNKEWDYILTEKLAEKMIYISSEDGYTEDLNSIILFFEYIKRNISYNYFVSVINKWDSMSFDGQISLALSIVGEGNASRFLLLSDAISAMRERNVLNED